MDKIVDESARTDPPKLKEKINAMLVCLIFGLGTLLPWNSILSLGDYYYEMFPKYHPSRVLTLAYQPFDITTLAILLYKRGKINTMKRNLTGYILFTIGTSTLLLIDLATAGKGGVGNYIAICLVVSSFGVASAHVQGGVVGEISSMCPEFIQSFFAGIAASGAFTSILRLVTKAVFKHSTHSLRKGAILFMSIAAFLELLCVMLYAFVFPNLPIVRYYRAKAASEVSHAVECEDGSLSNMRLLVENIDYALDLFLIYALTLSIFPGFLYENTGTHKLGSWYPIVLVAVFNMWDLISRYIPLVESIALKSRKGLMIATLSRFLMIPCFYFTARYGNEGWMIMLVSFLGITNGYLTVCVLTTAPQCYKGPDASALSNILVLSLLFGVLCGAALDLLWLIGNGNL